MTPFFKNLQNRFINPIMQNPQYSYDIAKDNTSLITLECTIDNSLSKSWTNRNNSENGLYSLLIKIFGSIENNVFDFSSIENDKSKCEMIKKEFLKIMGEYIQAKTTKLIIKNYLEKSIPKHIDDLDLFDDIAIETKNYETYLKSKWLISENNYDLTNYCDEIDIHFINQKHNILMHDVQKLIISSEYELELIEETTFSPDAKIFENDTTSQKASELSQLSSNKNKMTEFSFDFEQNFITFPRCCIDTKTKQLLSLVFNTIKETSKMTSPCLYRLYYSIRDVFDYYRAVVPICHSESIQTNSELCAVFHNNCMYISHHLMLMSFQNRELFVRIAEYEKQNKKFIKDNKEVKQHVTMLDLIIQFRKLGEKFFNHQLCIYKQEILNTIRSTNGFEMIEKNRDEIVESALCKVNEIIQKLAMAWKPILPAYMYLEVMGKIYDLVLKECIRQVQKLSDITKDESDKLNELLSMFCQCEDIFDNVIPNESLENIIHQYIPHYKKFSGITDIMLLSLAEIMENFRQKVYQGFIPETNSDGNINPNYLKDGFYPEELIKLIKALFSESSLRSKSIEEIKKFKA